MIIRKAPKIFKPGDRQEIVRFAFWPVQLIEKGRIVPHSLEPTPDIIKEVIWLERYVETYVYRRKINSSEGAWEFDKSERMAQYVIDKLER